MAQPSCAGSVQACALRVAVLEADGVPLPGAGNLYTTNQLMQVTWTPETDAGNDLFERSACGDPLVSLKENELVKRFTVSLEIGYPDPELTQMILGGNLVTQGGLTIGYSYPALATQPTSQQTNGVSVEFWTKRAGAGGQSQDYPYWRFVFPKAINWFPAERKAGREVMLTTFTGNTSENVNWFNGPLNDWSQTTGGITSRSFFYRMETTIPTTACGSQTLPAS